MINPALIAQGAEMRPALSPEEILQNQSIPGYLQQQQQTTDADLPASQAAASQAETAQRQFELAQAQKQAAIQNPIQALIGGRVLGQLQSQGTPQAQQTQSSTAPGVQASTQSQTPASDALIALSKQASSPTAALYKQYGIDYASQLPAAQSATEAEQSRILASPEWQSKISGIGIKNTNATNLQNEYRAENPAINFLPDGGQKIMDAAFKANAPQTVFGNMYNQPLASDDISYYAQQLAGSKMDMKELANDIGSRMTGASKAHTIAQIQQAAQKLDPTFSPVSNEADAAYFSSPKIKTTMAQIQQAYQTIQAINDDLGTMNNGQYPTMNAAKQIIGKESGMPMGALANIDKIIGIDEIAPVLSRTGTNTDNVRSLAGQLADPTRSPAQQQAVTGALLKAFGRTLNSYGKQMGGFSDLQPAMETTKTPTPSNPQDAQAAAWAKANPTDPRSAAILRKLGQ